MPPVDEFLAGLGFAEPPDPLRTPLPPRPAAPAIGQSPMVDPATLAALGLPFPTAQGSEMPGSAPPTAVGDAPLGQESPTGGLSASQPGPSADLMAALGSQSPAADIVTPPGAQPSEGATQDSAAPLLYGYQPQPRPALPGAIGTPPEEGANDPFAQFRGVYGGDTGNGKPSPDDLIAGLTGGDASLPGMPGEPPPGRALSPPWMGGGSGGGSFGPGPEPGPGHQLMRDRFPGALQRLNWLRDLRTKRGY
jgi:hypothetical protein